MWWSLTSRPEFSPGSLDRHWDVVIIGGGFSGLWSAHHLIAADPSLKIAVLEKDQIGSGASGRNGGWVSALYPTSDETLMQYASTQEIAELHSQLESSIDAIGEFAAQEKIECGFHKGGSLSIATNSGQLTRMRAIAEPGGTFLNSALTNSRINMAGALGAIYTPHCAAINPAALIVGLAQSLERKGVSIFEKSCAQFLSDGGVAVAGVSVHSDAYLRSIEAYHANTREQIPIYSLMIATEPLPSQVFDEIGIANRETFADASYLVNYAQRTSDNRLAIGGRGAPYSLGSRRNDSRENMKKIYSKLETMAREWFPVLHEHAFSYAWGGAVGVTRDWAPYLRWDGKNAQMGGYAGDGLTLSYLVASSAADVILGKDSVRTHLPFVQWRNPEWEIEPLRWMAVNAAIALSSAADFEERITGKQSLIMKALSPIIGK